MLSREKQRELLLQLRELYPGSGSFQLGPGETAQEVAANLVYLEEHGLCESGVQVGIDGHIMLNPSRITAAGIDFLAEDGGLSAVLGVITVKLHADTIRNLIAERIDTAEIPAEEKSLLKKHLSALPEAALRAGTTDLVQTGLKHLPDAVHWLRSLLGL
jgi:hypothetical protein